MFFDKSPFENVLTCLFSSKILWYAAYSGCPAAIVRLVGYSSSLIHCALIESIPCVHPYTGACFSGAYYNAKQRSDLLEQTLLSSICQNYKSYIKLLSF